jgi:hypothetical protein
MRAELPWPVVHDYPPLDILSLLAPKEWHARARCTMPSVNPDWWFYERSSDERYAGYLSLTEIRAKTHCARCPVRMDCMLDGLYETAGIWGGTLPTERRRYRHLEGCQPGTKVEPRLHAACVPDEEQAAWLLFDMEVQAREKGWIAREEQVV